MPAKNTASTKDQLCNIDTLKKKILIINTNNYVEEAWAEVVMSIRCEKYEIKYDFVTV